MAFNSANRTYRSFILTAVLLLFSSTVYAQEPLSWDDAPDTAPIRHMGDWMVGMGWYPPEEVYGPFPEAAFEVGDTTTFYADLYTDTNTPPRSYILRHKGEHAYYWFEESTLVDRQELATAAQFFDAEIFPYVHSIFGSIDSAGIDGDPRLHIVHEVYVGFGAMGFFSTDDQCPAALCPGSNQRDIIYYSLDSGAVNSEEYRTTITHEYQHVIRHHQDGNERRWMNEGLSQLTEHLTGFAPRYSVGENLNTFLTNPNHRLDGWADYSTDPSIFYGSSYLFMVYLYEQFGLDFIRQLAASPYDGLAAAHHSLRDHNADLNSTFADWLVANYLDDPFVGDGRYYYATLGLPIRVRTEPLFASPDRATIINRSINQYGASYFALDAGRYEIIFDGADTTPLVSDVQPFSGEDMWWGYNAESSATRLTRHFDLSEVNVATLHFGLWYETERDYDWLAVLVSTDGGERWKALESPTMQPATDEIPIPHYSGRSRGWLQEEIDLSAYSGQQDVLLRFEYVTDGTNTLAGVLLDDLRVPQIDFYDDLDWQADGFLYVANQVLQDWALAFITKGNTPNVTFWEGDAKNIYRQVVDVPSGGGILVLGAMAPLTAEKGTYKLVINTVTD